MSDEQGRTQERWAQVREILADALELPEAERPDFVRARCGGDAEMIAEVEELLAASAVESGFLDRTPEHLSMAALEAPESIGPYRLHEVLGEGGMGTVYRAVQTEPMQREVALKIIKPGMDTREVVARFESERQALAVMDHSGIARVLDAGTTSSDRPYFVMELVRGVPIDEYCDTHKLTTRARIELFIQLADAIQHAHQKGVIHRDLKPSNVLVTVQDATPVPKVIDFGIAKAVGGSVADRPLMTTMGQILGTPAYMSPEQAERTGLDVDTRTDVYSLGAMLYELLSGTLPFEPDTLRKPDFIVQHLLREKDVPRPSARLSALADTQETVARNRHTDVRTLRRELSGDLDWIVMKAMDKDRTRRYGSASELAADLRRFLDGEPVSARPPSAGYRTRKFARRHRGPLAAGLALAIALAGGAIVSTVGFVRAERNAQLASESASRAEAVRDFLDQMLRAADPVVGGGPSTTVEEVLDAASEEVSSGALADRPFVEIEVRRSIGGTYMRLGLLDKADEHLERALLLLEQTPDASELERLIAIQEIGQLRRRQGDPNEAVAWYRHALALADSAGFTNDGDAGERNVNRVRNDLGLALRETDRIDEAAEVLEALADSRRGLLAPNDIELATTLNNLALVKNAQGDLDGAIALFTETLAVLRAALGDSHVYVAAVLESTGSLEQTMGRYDNADSLMTAAMVMRKEILGERHPDIVNGYNSLGMLHVDMRDYDAAQEYLDAGLAMSVELLGERHTRTAVLHNSIGLLYLGREESEAAEASFRNAVSIREEALGARHRNTLNANTNLAAALFQAGRYSESEALARYVVGVQEEIGMVDAVLVGSAHRMWGKALTELDRFEAAEEQLLESYRGLDAVHGPDHPHARTTAQALVELYERWDRPQDVAEWRGRAGG